MRGRRDLIFVISGPSGSGKTTLTSRILDDPEFKKKLIRSISFTTRPKRSGERNKKDYFFITEEEFKAKLKAKKILEWTRYIGYYYATPKEYVEEQLGRGKSVILCLDVKGASAVKKLYPKDTVTIFVVPPLMDELKKRIVKRCQRTHQEEIRLRLERARQEMRQASKFDYRLVNEELPRAVVELKKIILSSLRKG